MTIEIALPNLTCKGYYTKFLEPDVFDVSSTIRIYLKKERPFDSYEQTLFDMLMAGF